ncbi:MAG: AraC family transcriptional regulator [Waltera sp.]
MGKSDSAAFDTYFSLQEAKETNELGTMQLLLQLWNILFENKDWKSDPDSIHRLNHKQAGLQTMMQYIHDHYMEEITAGNDCSIGIYQQKWCFTHFSIQHPLFSGSISDSIQTGAGCRTALYYSKSVFSIAEENGFTSSSYFCRKFRQHYHMSPNEYRKKKLTHCISHPV